MLTDEELATIRRNSHDWPDDYPPAVDELLAHIDAQAEMIAAERALADALAAALDSSLWDDDCQCPACALDAALARYRAARQAGTGPIDGHE